MKSGSGQLVSVGIVTWNSIGVIRDCLAALDLEASGAPFDIEFVLVDNASADGTADWVQRRYPAVRVLRNERNEGFSAAANRIVRESRGEFIFLLNPDCRIRLGYLTALLDGLRSSGPRFGSAGGKLLFPRLATGGDDVIDSAGFELTATLRIRDRGHGQLDRGRYDADEEVFGVCAAAALYRRDLLDDLASRTGEVFDESLGSYKEDADLAWRARRLGWSAAYVAEAVAEHTRGFAAHRRMQVPAWLRRQSFRNRYLLLAKNATVGDVLRRLPALAAFEFGALAYALLRDRALLRAYPDAARLLRIAWPKRHRPVAGRRWAASRSATSRRRADAPRAVEGVAVDEIAVAPRGESN